MEGDCATTMSQATFAPALPDFSNWADEVPEAAFSDLRTLRKVSVPSRFKKIGRVAFDCCSGVIELTLPGKLEAIGEFAFRGCTGISELTLHDALVEIGRSAFRDCSGLRELTLPNSLVKVGYGAFAGCLGLTKLTLSKDFVKIGSDVFRGCSGLTRITFPKSLQSIGDGAFSECTRLLELELPASVHTIGSRQDRDRFCSGAFEGCTNLRTLILPPSLTWLGAGSFKGSTVNLLMVVVPRTVSREVATTMAAMLGSRTEDDCWGANPIDVPAVSTVQLVSAPDAVVASLGGVFAAMNTMAEVRAAGRDVAVLGHHHWTVMTHAHKICTSSQRACAHTVLLVGAWLHARAVSCRWVPTEASMQLPLGAALPDDPTQLQPLPDELWVEVLGWLRRSELGAAV
jgi:hypothetical protein